MKHQDYPLLLDRLEGLSANTLIVPRWPVGSSPLALEAALTAFGHADRKAEFSRQVASTRAQLDMLGRPIIAVLGQLNSGKSSVVATFLSPIGQARVPRGDEEAKGTHRFVYWAPSAWRADDATKEAFFGLLDAVHGRQRELLADDPAVAATQYRSGRDDPAKLQIPLVAFDPCLDAVGAALLDCPDVQTHDGGSAPAAVENRRLEMLVQASHICSAFLVVWLRAMVRDGLLERMLADVRRHLATAPLFLLLNKIDPEPGQPAVSRNDSNVNTLLECYKIAQDAVFGAFHFKVPGWRDLTPPELVRDFDTSPEQLPQFFQIASEDPLNDAASIEQKRFLNRLPARLDLADLQRRKMEDSWSDLGRVTCECIASLRVSIRANERRAAEMHRGMLDICVEQMTDPATGEARQVLSKEFAEAFEFSLRGNAPLWVRIAMQAARPINWVGSGLRKKVSECKAALAVLAEIRGQGFNAVREKLSDVFAQEFQDQSLVLFDPESLARKMKSMRWVPVEIAEKPLGEGWTAALSNFRHYPLEIDSAELDRMTGDIWKSLGGWKKLKFALKNFLAAVGSLVAAASVLVVAIDGGATFFATFSFAGWLSGALSSQLMLAAAAGGGAAVGASLLLQSINVNTLPYLSRLFALAADAFGLPRELGPEPLRVSFGPRKNRQIYVLPPPGVPVQETVCRLADLRLWEETSKIREIEHLCTL